MATTRTNTTSFEVQQALHGYRDGHALLASSLELSAAAKRTMLVLSDMSGPSMTKGFESYLTAYPLREDKFYVVARTWHAPEMNRPGCVWTHSLMIKMADVAKVSTLTSLTSLFNRPQSEVLDRYTSAIESIGPLSDQSIEPFAQSQKGVAEQVMDALYDDSARPVVLLSDTSRDYEILFSSIWSQQWPRLRRTFSFCSGAISFRTFESVPFDLQAMPYHRSYSLTRESFANVTLIDPKAKWRSSNWIRQAAVDLTSEVSCDYRQFLWDNGSDITQSRAAFKPLSQIYLAVGNKSPGRDALSLLLDIVTESFPTPSDAKRLKASLFGCDERISAGYLGQLSEGELLNVLTTSGNSSSLDPHALSIKQRAADLWKTDRYSAVLIATKILQNDVSPIGAQFINGIAEVIEPFEAIELDQNTPGLLAFFSKLNPQIVTSPAVWHANVSKQREILDALSAIDSFGTDKIWKVLPAVLQFADDKVAPDVVRVFGDLVVPYILEHIDNPTVEYSSAWRQALSTRPDIVLSWLQKHPGMPLQTVTRAISLLNPNSRLVMEFPVSNWIKIANLDTNQLVPQQTLNLSVFLLALGLECGSGDGARLLSASFQNVHDAVASDKIPYVSWKMIEPSLPEISFWRSWDKCERLRRGTVDKFIAQAWSLQEFERCAPSDGTFKLLIGSASSTANGRDLINALLNAVQSGDVQMMPNRMDIILAASRY